MVLVKTFLLFSFFAVKFSDGRRSKLDDVVSSKLTGACQELTFCSQEQLIENGGHRSESYHVHTEDGYILKVHRIRTKVISVQPRLGPVFFMHGLTATSADYLMTGPEIGLRKKTCKFVVDLIQQLSFQHFCYPEMDTMFGWATRGETITV